MAALCFFISGSRKTYGVVTGKTGCWFVARCAGLVLQFTLLAMIASCWDALLKKCICLTLGSTGRHADGNCVNQKLIFWGS
ncbi:hypothetical protein RR11_1594 [Ruegeria sp. R11]|nr:hypothetical protein RR11_1594 [Ruegeria sp. R11]